LEFVAKVKSKAELQFVIEFRFSVSKVKVSHAITNISTSRVFRSRYV